MSLKIKYPIIVRHADIINSPPLLGKPNTSFTTNRLLQASSLLQGRGYWGDVCAQAARGGEAVVSGVHCYSPTTASAHRGRIALLPHCHQLPHMQSAAGRGQSTWSFSHCGKLSGSAHSRCNLAYRISKYEWKLPVVIHNLKGFDGHLIDKALKSEFGEVRVIPQNMEKYVTITVDRLKFIDSPIHFSESGQSPEDHRS